MDDNNQVTVEATPIKDAGTQVGTLFLQLHAPTDFDTAVQGFKPGQLQHSAEVGQHLVNATNTIEAWTKGCANTLDCEGTFLVNAAGAYPEISQLGADDLKKRMKELAEGAAKATPAPAPANSPTAPKAPADPKAHPADSADSPRSPLPPHTTLA
jgi:uncharacterized Fe-S center protein